MDKYSKKVMNILNKTSLSENSKKNYLSHMKKIYKLMDHRGFSFNFLKDIEKVSEIINDQSDSSKKMIYISIAQVVKNVKGFKKISNIYKEKSLKITKKLNEKYSENELNEKQKDIGDFQSLKDIVKKWESKYIKSPNKTNKKKYLASLLYVMLDFTPRLNYASMKIIKNMSEDNGRDNFLYIGENKMVIILNDYKTKKQYGKIEYEIEEDVEEKLRELNIGEQEYLFTSNKGGPYIATKFSQFLKTVFGFGVNGIRIIKENHLQNSKYYRGLSMKEKEKIHNELFLHSGFIAMSIYRKKELIDLYN